MFKSIKKIKDKLYFLYIDKVVNSPAALDQAKVFGGVDLDDKNTSVIIIEEEPSLPTMVEQEVEVISNDDHLVEAIVPVEEIKTEEVKKKAGRPKSTTKTTTKSTTKKVPSKKIDPSN